VSATRSRIRSTPRSPLEIRSSIGDPFHPEVFLAGHRAKHRPRFRRPLAPDAPLHARLPPFASPPLPNSAAASRRRPTRWGACRRGLGLGPHSLLGRLALGSTANAARHAAAHQGQIFAMLAFLRIAIHPLPALSPRSAAILPPWVKSTRWLHDARTEPAKRSVCA
jgi:hypothetical protein